MQSMILDTGRKKVSKEIHKKAILITFSLQKLCNVTSAF